MTSALKRHRKKNDPVAAVRTGALAAFVLAKILDIALLLPRFSLRARSRLRSVGAPGLVSFVLRRLLTLSPIALVLAFAVFALAVPACYQKASPTRLAALQVKAEPENTSVYVNDSFVATARVLAVKPAPMKPGVKFITLKAPGYFPHDLRVELPSGTTLIEIELRPVPP